MIKKTVLKNGLRVATMHVNSIASSVGVFVGAGAVNETSDEHGLSHYLEHMAFKGTKTRSVDDIAEQIEFSGGSTNAYTSYSHTAYYANVLNSEVKNTVDIILDSVFNSIFPEQEIETERSVIKQEIMRGEDNPSQVCFYNLHDAMYKDQPLSSNIIGTFASLDSFNKQSFENYVKKWYVPNNIIVVATGKIDHDDFVRHVDGLVGHIPAGNLSTVQYSVFTGGLKTFNKSYEQTNLFFSFEGYAKEDIKNAQASEMLAAYLSDGMCSPLFKEVREKRGLVYFVDSSSSSFDNTGYFSIMAGTSKEHVDELIKVSLNEIEGVITNFDDKHLRRAKNKIKMMLGKYQESTMGTMKYIGSNWLGGDEYLKEFDDIAEMSEEITKQEIQDIAEKILNNKKAFSVVGPISDESIKYIESLI